MNIAEVRARALELAIQRHGSTASDECIKRTAKEYEAFIAPELGRPIWTASTLTELRTAVGDPVYFFGRLMANAPCPLMGTPRTPYQHQNDILGFLQNNPCAVIKNARQIGTSITLTAYLLWRALGATDQTFLVFAPTYTSAVEAMRMIQNLHDVLPSHLRPVITHKTKTSITFDNGCIIRAHSAAYPNACRGMTVTQAVIMDAAFISHKAAGDLMYNLFPCTRSVIVQSSVGVSDGMFYEMWRQAEAGFSSYAYMNIPWHVHPDRDQAFETDMVARIGQEAFDRQFNCKFS